MELYSLFYHHKTLSNTFFTLLNGYHQSIVELSPIMAYDAFIGYFMVIASTSDTGKELFLEDIRAFRVEEHWETVQ